MDLRSHPSALRGVVKNQADCGSCWTFATTGAMQGAWYYATGEMASFSDQQLLDCSWAYGNAGCQGGLVEQALTYVSEHGGVALNEDYQYLGQNAVCLCARPGVAEAGMQGGVWDGAEGPGAAQCLGRTVCVGAAQRGP